MLLHKMLSFRKLTTAIAIFIAMTFSFSIRAQGRMVQERGAVSATTENKSTGQSTTQTTEATPKSTGSTGGI